MTPSSEPSLAGSAGYQKMLLRYENKEKDSVLSRGVTLMESEKRVQRTQEQNRGVLQFDPDMS